MDGVLVTGNFWSEASATAAPWGRPAKGRQVLQSVREFYSRQSSDDLLFLFLVLIDAYTVQASVRFALQSLTNRLHAATHHIVHVCVVMYSLQSNERICCVCS